MNIFNHTNIETNEKISSFLMSSFKNIETFFEKKLTCVFITGKVKAKNNFSRKINYSMNGTPTMFNMHVLLGTTEIDSDNHQETFAFSFKFNNAKPTDSFCIISRLIEKSKTDPFSNEKQPQFCFHSEKFEIKNMLEFLNHLTGRITSEYYELLTPKSNSFSISDLRSEIFSVFSSDINNDMATKTTTELLTELNSQYKNDPFFSEHFISSVSKKPSLLSGNSDMTDVYESKSSDNKNIEKIIKSHSEKVASDPEIQNINLEINELSSRISALKDKKEKIINDKLSHSAKQRSDFNNNEETINIIKEARQVLYSVANTISTLYRNKNHDFSSIQWRKVKNTLMDSPEILKLSETTGITIEDIMNIK